MSSLLTTKAFLRKALNIVYPYPIFYITFVQGQRPTILQLNCKMLSSENNNGRLNSDVLRSKCTVTLLYHTSVIRLRLLSVRHLCNNRLHSLFALFTPSHRCVQNMLQEFFTLTRGQVVEEILRCHLNEPAHTKKQDQITGHFSCSGTVDYLAV